MLYKLRSVKNTGTCYPGLGWICQVHLTNQPSLLICFIAYIFHFFYSSVGLVGKFAGLPSCTVPIVVRMRLVINQSKLPACLAGVLLAHENTLWHLCQDWWNWQIKWIKSISVGSYQYKNQVNGEFFVYLWVILLYFSLESRLIPAMLELGQVRFCFENWLDQEFDSCHIAVKLEFKSISKPFSTKIAKYEDWILILGQNDIFCGHNVVNFSVWFLQLTVFLVASHVTESGSLLIEPGALIKFSHFYSHPGTCML